MGGWPVAGLLLLLAASTPASPPAVSILSRPENVTRAEGETVGLPCTVHNLGPRQQVVWRRGNAVLAAGRILLSPDPRLAVAEPPQAKLYIKGLVRTDEGEYACQVTTLAGVLEVQHRLQVRVPPSIHPVPSGGLVTGRQGEPVTLRCNASGVPAPSIQWHKSVGTVPSGAVACGGGCLTIPRLTRSGGGDYMCTASNGVGPLQHATLTLSVLYPPVVEPVTGSVQGGGGQPARLACQVSGQPQPRLDWFRDGELRGPEGSRVTEEWSRDGRLHTLTIQSCTAADFGNYSCVASNLLGSGRSFLEVHGRPGAPAFLPLGTAPRGQVSLRWQCLSHYRVSLFTLLYRPAGEEQWSTVRVVASGGAQGEVQEADYLLTNLTAGGGYEALVQAQNSYGWSTPSKILGFQTAGEARKSASSLWSDTAAAARPLPTPAGLPLAALALASWCSLH